MEPRIDFDIDEFLSRPLVARVAAAGPTVRPVWFVWEEKCLWWPTGSWSRLEEILVSDPRLAVVVDTCDFGTGRVLQVNARGRAEVGAADPDRMMRLFAKYLGPDRARWDSRFDPHEEGLRMVRLRPERISARELSYSVSGQLPPASPPAGGSTLRPRSIGWRTGPRITERGARGRSREM